MFFYYLNINLLHLIIVCLQSSCIICVYELFTVKSQVKSLAAACHFSFLC